jgi:hypothetical protein
VLFIESEEALRAERNMFCRDEATWRGCEVLSCRAKKPPGVSRRNKCWEEEEMKI